VLPRAADHAAPRSHHWWPCPAPSCSTQHFELIGKHRSSCLGHRPPAEASSLTIVPSVMVPVPWSCPRSGQRHIAPREVTVMLPASVVIAVGRTRGANVHRVRIGVTKGVAEALITAATAFHIIGAVSSAELFTPALRADRQTPLQLVSGHRPTGRSVQLTIVPSVMVPGRWSCPAFWDSVTSPPRGHRDGCPRRGNAVGRTACQCPPCSHRW